MLRRTFCQISPYLGHSRQVNAACLGIQQKRYERIFRRMHPPKVAKEGEEGMRLYDKEPYGVPGITNNSTTWAHIFDDDFVKFTRHGDEFVYILEKDTDEEPVGDIDVILCWDIEGLGSTGDKVRVNRDMARQHLITLGAAVYVTPESTEKYRLMSEENDRKRATGEEDSIPEGYDRVTNMLESIVLPIPMNLDVQWTLTRSHVRIAFRRQGIHIPEEFIQMLDDQISNDSDPQLQVNVTLNMKSGKAYKVIPVKAVVVDKASAEARATPFVQTFKYEKKTLTDLLLDKYAQMKTTNSRAQLKSEQLQELR